MLAREPRKAMVSAISHSTLLELDETRFRRMMARNKTLLQAVAESAAKRGVVLDLSAFEPTTGRQR